MRKRGSADGGNHGQARQLRGRRATARCMNCFTTRSSSEWKLMTASRPPTASTSRGGGEPALELAQLVVDEHAQGLERAGRGMLAGLARAHGARHELRELRWCA